MRMVENYFSQRMLLYDTTLGRKSRPLSGGVALSSLKCPDFWGPLIGRLLRMALPERITLVGFVNGTAAIIVAPNLNTDQTKSEIIMLRVSHWMEEHGIQLALEKTEIVILSGKRIEMIVPIRISDQIIETKPSPCTLG